MARGRKTGGRKKGTPNKRTERERRLLAEADDADKAIVDRVIFAARNGDPEATRIYFRYLRPSAAREMFVRPVSYAQPKTVEEARATLLVLGVRLAKGEISVEMHDTLVGGLKVYLSDRAVEQQKQLDALEDSMVVDRPMTGNGARG
jgi:hypothetical protein